MGSTGDPPVPSGDPPDGTGGGIERKGVGCWMLKAKKIVATCEYL
jgi:hypothetical protein